MISLTDWMHTEEKFIIGTTVFSTTQSSDGDVPVQEQTTSSPHVPSSTVAPTQRATTVEDLETTVMVTDGPNETEEVELLQSHSS